MRTRNAVIGGVAAVATLSVVGIGIAEAAPSATPSSPSSQSGTPAKQAKHGHPRALAERALHGQATVGGAKKQRVVDFQRGTVTAVGSGHLTVKSVDGFTATYTTDAKTRVHRQQAASTLGAVRTGDRIRVLAVQTGATKTARAIRDRGPK